MLVASNLLPEDGQVTVASQHAGAGCVLLESPLTGGSKLCVVAACPAWYMGKVPALTCMMPPEAARVAKSLEGGTLPRVSPDCLLGQGYDPEGRKREDLRRVTAAIQAPKRLREAAEALRAAGASVSTNKGQGSLQ